MQLFQCVSVCNFMRLCVCVLYVRENYCVSHVAGVRKSGCQLVSSKDVGEGILNISAFGEAVSARDRNSDGSTAN